MNNDFSFWWLIDTVFHDIIKQNFQKGKRVLKNITSQPETHFPYIQKTVLHLSTRIQNFITLSYLSRTVSHL